VCIFSVVGRKNIQDALGGIITMDFFQNRWPNSDEVWVFWDSIDQPATEARGESRILLRQHLMADDVFVGMKNSGV
jgi:hypothetical protein